MEELVIRSPADPLGLREIRVRKKKKKREWSPLSPDNTDRKVG